MSYNAKILTFTEYQQSLGIYLFQWNWFCVMRAHDSGGWAIANGASWNGFRRHRRQTKRSLNNTRRGTLSINCQTKSDHNPMILFVKRMPKRFFENERKVCWTKIIYAIANIYHQLDLFFTHDREKMWNNEQGISVSDLSNHKVIDSDVGKITCFFYRMTHQD